MFLIEHPCKVAFYISYSLTPIKTQVHTLIYSIRTQTTSKFKSWTERQIYGIINEDRLCYKNVSVLFHVRNLFTADVWRL